MAITLAKVDFPKFREGWAVPPDGYKSHYMFRIELTNVVVSACGNVRKEIDHHGNGLHALWQEGSFERCKRCSRTWS